MSRDLEDLIGDFRPKVDQLLADCRARGCEMRPYSTLRPAQEQAKLWRRSRTSAEIEAKIQELDGKGATFLAQVIADVGPQSCD